MKFRSASIRFACLVVALRQLVAKASPAKRDPNDDKEQRECSIFMAPSSVKGLKGYGVFTTRDIDEGSNIMSAPDAPSIPIYYSMRDASSDAADQWMTVFGEYWWTRGRPDHVVYDADADFQTTFGALPNHHCILDSLDSKFPRVPYDDSIVNRFHSPGAGAYSYSLGREWFTSRDLRAGDEIFLNYGYCERDDGADDGWTSQLPMPEDYVEAAEIAWKWLKNDKDDYSDIPKGTRKLVTTLLPESTSELHDIVSSSNEALMESTDLIPLLAKYVASSRRTPQWVRANGMCLEHLVPGKSTIANAGFGAFAQHVIREGEIVVPAPMLQIADRDALIMYNDDGNETGKQVSLNYCLGHGESSLLLCPITNAGLINHCSNRKKQCGSNGPNAEYRWSSGWDPTSDKWRTWTVEEIASQSGRGLSMEVVALRDVEPGEEVFVDYGEEWEEAWDEYVSNWIPPQRYDNDKHFMTAKEANERTDLDFLVTGDLREESTHSHLFTGCRYYPTRQDKHNVWNQRDPSWVDWDDDEILIEFSDDGSRYEGNYSSHSDMTHWPCSVISHDEDGTYTVRIHQADWAKPTRWHRNDLPRFLTNYPRESIHYFVEEYESDQLQSDAFRQPIGIPDEIFPEQWKNRKERKWVVWQTGASLSTTDE